MVIKKSLPMTGSWDVTVVSYFHVLLKVAEKVKTNKSLDLIPKFGRGVNARAGAHNAISVRAWSGNANIIFVN